MWKQDLTNNNEIRGKVIIRTSSGHLIVYIRTKEPGHMKTFTMQ